MQKKGPDRRDNELSWIVGLASKIAYARGLEAAARTLRRSALEFEKCGMDSYILRRLARDIDRRACKIRKDKADG